MLFEFTGSLLINAIFGTNASKSQRLTKWNRGLAMFGVAAIHTEVLVFVRRFDV